MAKRKLSSNQICYRISLALLPIMLGLSLLYQAGIFIPTKIFPPCMFHALTGFSCPGCGSTRAVSALLTHQFKTSTGNLLLCPYLYRLCPFSYTGITHKWHKKETPLSFQKGMFSSSFFSFSRYAPKRKYPLCTCMDFPRFWCTAIWL